MNLSASHITAVAQRCHATAKAHGFWDDAEEPSDASRQIALMALDISRIGWEVEAIRKGEPDSSELGSDHRMSRMGKWQYLTPHQLTVLAKLVLIASEVAEAIETIFGDDDTIGDELADIHIRTFDLAHYCGFDSGSDIIVKAELNDRRPFKHEKLA